MRNGLGLSLEGSPFVNNRPLKLKSAPSIFLVLIVSVSLNQVSGSRARARADKCAFPTANQGAAACSNKTPDDCALGTAMMMPLMAIAPLTGERYAAYCAEKQSQADKDRKQTFAKLYPHYLYTSSWLIVHAITSTQ